MLAAAMAGLGRNAAGEESGSSPPQPAPQEHSSQLPSASVVPESVPLVTTQSPSPAPANEPLFDFKNSDIKFNLDSLMKTLRDSKHEGWVLAAYPDPKTSRPLIGAGFSLDVAETEHIQRDPLNPNRFIEPSSAQLWQAAGLDPEKMQKILGQFDRNLKAWKKKNYRKKIKTHSLPPQLTEEEATSLLRISAIQAIHNAKAYCRNFDQLTAAQQMALSQLVFQMGVNLEEFVQFLAAINGEVGLQNAPTTDGGTYTEAEYWKAVQRTLIESQWARRYSIRAAAVIAMFEPDYVEDPKGAERRVYATIHPPAKHHRKKPRQESVRARERQQPGQQDAEQEGTRRSIEISAR
jgi:hypothetical protein